MRHDEATLCLPTSSQQSDGATKLLQKSSFSIHGTFIPEFEMVSVVDDNAVFHDLKLPWNDRAKVAHQISSKVRAWKKCPQRKLCFT